MPKETLTRLKGKSLEDFLGSKIGTLRFLFLLRRNISTSADFMRQFRAFLPRLCGDYALCNLKK